MNVRKKRGGLLRPVAIDLFAGAGGLSLGLEQAGFDVILAVDRDPYHICTFRRNFPQSMTICTDIRRLDGRNIRKLIGGIDVDLVCGGPPCQGFSHIGNRHSSDPRNALVKHFVRLVIELRPKAFLMENVPGLKSSWTKSALDNVIEGLMTAGYRITEPVQSLDAARFGVPQRRQRIFVVGTRAEFNTAVVYPLSSCKHRPTFTSVWDAIRDLPRLSGREDLFDSDVSRYRTSFGRCPHLYAALARGLRADPCDLAYPRVWSKKHCTGCSRVRHRSDVIRLYAATPRGRMVPSHNLPRLEPRGLSPTLRAGTDNEHGSFNAPRPIHPYEPRCITVREAARLHGFPDWFRFFPAKWHAHRQIGNSVCPPVARALGLAIRTALKLRASRPSQQLELREDFDVPKHRGKRVRRISQLTEWPKVLADLLQEAGPSSDGTLRKATFSVHDVALSYRRTGARMPRTPPGRLLADIARSRNRHKLLAELRNRGFSIAHIGQNGAYGRFVPADTPGTLEAISTLAITHSDIAAAKRLRGIKGTSLSHVQMLNLLQQPSIIRHLLHSDKLVYLDDIRSPMAKRRCLRCLFHSRSRKLKAIVMIASYRSLPELSSVQSLLAKLQVHYCIVLAAITRRHMAAFVVVKRGEQVFVKARSVFEVPSL